MYKELMKDVNGYMMVKLKEIDQFINVCNGGSKQVLGF